jgi:hypothetical protein
MGINSIPQLILIRYAESVAINKRIQKSYAHDSRH